jgi:hypothetical protein
MGVCTLVEKDGTPNWCGKHKSFHGGHYAEYALDPGPKGEKFRAFWDKGDSSPKPVTRSPREARSCLHLGPATGKMIEVTSYG